jgi:hypothetical protein
MAIVSMSVNDIMLMHSCDYAHMHWRCEECGRKYGRHRIIKRGVYQAFHRPGSKCRGVFYYTTRTILLAKMDDDQFDDVLESVQREPGHAWARVKNNVIYDGHHRIAAGIYLRKTYIDVEDAFEESAHDSGRWYPTMEIAA